MNLQDCYRTLELEPGASIDEVKRAYRELAQVWHPDRFAAKPALQGRANAKLMEINAAYRELLRRLEGGEAARPRSGAPDAARPASAASRPSGRRKGSAHYRASTRTATGAPGDAPYEARSAPDADAPAADVPSASPPPSASAPMRRRRVPAIMADWRFWVLAAAACLLVFAIGAAVVWHRNALRFEAIVLPPGGPTSLDSVAAGASHSCGLAADGRLLCWGADDAGQLGRAATRTCTDASGDNYRCDPEPSLVGGWLRFAQVVVGLDHSCALTTEGVAYCWGAGYAGQAGDGQTTSRSTPVPVAGDLLFESLSALGQHTCAVTIDGEAYCWGRDTDGQLGDPRAVRLCRLDNLRFGCSPVPIRVDGPGPWLQVTAGASHSCGLAADGAASCWGSNRSGQLGAASDDVCPDESGENPCALRPVPVETSLRFRSLAAGAAHTCGLALDGLAYCWGRNDAGQLGTGGTGNRDRPGSVAGNRRFVRLFAGGFHTCGLTAAGDLYCWGQNAFGQLGATSGHTCQGIPCTSAPRRVDIAGVVSGSAGFYGTCVVTKNRQLCWGRNDSGQLGSGSVRPGDARIPHEPMPPLDRSVGGVASAVRGLVGKAREVIRQAKNQADLPEKLERDNRW